MLADLLSKANLREFRDRCYSWDLNIDTAPAAVPRVLLDWVSRPRPDNQLGQRLLLHLAEQGVQMLGHN